ncbi:hypothetical protein STRATTON_83 [Erwinia phage vB_EamM_Stratton]|uniref:Uncharacterized protein n=2 Tax=Erskinevirus EaH2 TaxID=2169883 RepID=A0A1B2IGX2_9CAUD|nr:hypothetical protein G173_gp250 [Erwinia phage phiEaH2]AFQ96795.1 hypothetical protein [Erwinia phage phiEaH2]ANZ50508.1 hypothetical protein STRATTON_83 [Erwinia phage vB_EamM_Stratton]
MTKIAFIKDMTKCFGIAVMILASAIIGFLSPFAVIDGVTYLTGNMVIGALTGGAWGATLLVGCFMGWDKALVNYLKAKFKK